MAKKKSKKKATKEKDKPPYDRGFINSCFLEYCRGKSPYKISFEYKGKPTEQTIINWKNKYQWDLEKKKLQDSFRAELEQITENEVKEFMVDRKNWAKIVGVMIAIGAKGIQSKRGSEGDLKIKDLVKLLEFGWDKQRLLEGEPTDVTGVQVKTEGADFGGSSIASVLAQIKDKEEREKFENLMLDAYDIIRDQECLEVKEND